MQPGEEIRLHDLRHYRASALLRNGVPLALVSKMMGHSSVRVTADIYGHLDDETTREVAERVAAEVPRRNREAAA